jgi:hypothetical protein
LSRVARRIAGESIVPWCMNAGTYGLTVLARRGPDERPLP